MNSTTLIKRYRKTIIGVETQSCNCSVLLVGDAWRERGCGISYEYLNDIAVRTELERKIQADELSIAQQRVVSKLDLRLKHLLNANNVETSVSNFWQNGLPIGIAP